LVAFVLAVSVGWFIVNVVLAPQPQHQVTLSYTAFRAQVAADNVTSVTSQGDTITGVFKRPVPELAGSKTSVDHFQTQRPSFADSDLEPLLEQHGVTIIARPENTPAPLWQTLLFSFGPTVLLVLGFLYLSGRMGSAEA
jgi:cell division protease FtsH